MYNCILTSSIYLFILLAAFLTQTVSLEDATVKFEIWDTAGQGNLCRFLLLYLIVCIIYNIIQHIVLYMLESIYLSIYIYITRLLIIIF